MSVSVVLATQAPIAAQRPDNVITVEDGTVTIQVDNSRPLLLVVEVVAKFCQCVITFEEAPVVHESQLIDKTHPNYRGPHRALDVRAGPLTVSYPKAPPINQRDAVAFVEAAIESYKAAGYPSEYVVRVEGTFIHVVPDTVIDERGEQKAIRSLLDTPISLPSGDRLASLAIREIAAAVSKATGATILEGILPLNVFQNSLVNIAAHNEPAWSVLQRGFRSIRAVGSTCSTSWA